MWFDPLDEPIEWDETVEKVASKISQLGMETPAVLMLEAHKPLTFFVNQGLIFLAPFLYPLFGSRAGRAAKFFEDRANVEKLIRRIEQKASEREQTERAARTMHRAMRRARRQARRDRAKWKKP